MSVRLVLALAASLLVIAPAPASAVLVYARPAEDAIVAARDNGSASRVIAHGQTPVVSPNGRKVAFITVAGPKNEQTLRVVSITGGKPQRLARHVSGGFPLDAIAWSPNNRYVAIGRVNFGEYIVDLANGTRRVVGLGDLPGPRSFSPDSSKLLMEVVHPSDSEIDVARVEEGPARELFAGEDPVWGADGFAYRDFQKGIVFRRGVDAKVQLIRSRGHAVPRDWAADGETLLAAGGQYPDRLQALLIDRRTRATQFLEQRFSAIGYLSRNGRVVLGEQGGNVLAAWRDGSTRILAQHATTPSWTK
jgi:hypothetical protein